MYALAGAFEDLGGVIVQQCHVDHVENNEIIEVKTVKGHFKASSLVYATHIPSGVNLLHLRCKPMRSYAMAFTVTDNSYPNGLIYDLYNPYHYIRTEKTGGKKYLIVGENNHKTGDIENTDSCFMKLESYIRKYFNVDEIKFKWSSLFLILPMAGLHRSYARP
mgnify:FL=1